MTLAVAQKRVHVIQGEFKVYSDPEVVLTTILGSCIAACIRDPIAGVGGMNHFLLPGNSTAVAGSEATRYGVYLMELLVNGLLKKGAKRERLEAKMFGGARTMAKFSNVGQKNAEFATEFLNNEGIKLIGSSTGGEFGRKLEYWPVSGRARAILLSGVETKKTVELEVQPKPEPKPASSGIEFF